MRALGNGESTRDVTISSLQCQKRHLSPEDEFVDIDAPLTSTRSENVKRYVIERNLPGIGGLSREKLKEAATTSNRAISSLRGDVQWLHSYVVDDKTFCIYLAESEASVQEHARLSGFPANKISEVRGVIDPMTAIS